MKFAAEEVANFVFDSDDILQFCKYEYMTRLPGEAQKSQQLLTLTYLTLWEVK